PHRLRVPTERQVGIIFEAIKWHWERRAPFRIGHCENADELVVGWQVHFLLGPRSWRRCVGSTINGRAQAISHSPDTVFRTLSSDLPRWALDRVPVRRIWSVPDLRSVVSPGRR